MLSALLPVDNVFKRKLADESRAFLNCNTNIHCSKFLCTLLFKLFDVRSAGVHGVTCESGEHWNFICKTDDNFLEFVFLAV